MRMFHKNHSLLIRISLAALLVASGCSDAPPRDGVHPPISDAGTDGSWQIGEPDGSAGAVDADSGSLDFSGPARISVVPTPLSLVHPGVGNEQVGTLNIVNIGREPLTVSNIRLNEKMSGAFDEAQEFFEDSGAWGHSQAILESGDSLALSFKYAPVNVVEDEAEIIIDSDDAQNPRRTIPIVIETANPQISLPSTVIFPHVAPPERLPDGTLPEWSGVSKLIRVHNIGNAPLRIQDISIRGAGRFDFSIPHPTLEEIAQDISPDPANDDVVWPETLMPGEGFELRIWFSPRDALPVHEELTIQSNDSGAPQTRVRLQGNFGEPCIEALPDDIEFAPTPVGMTTRKSITVKNCSRSALLKLNEVNLSDDAGGIFAVELNGLPGTANDAARLMKPGESTRLVLSFSPLAEQRYTGAVTLKSNDPENPMLTLPLQGSTTAAACPTASATATLADDPSSQPASVLEARILDTIQLDGSASHAPGATVARYEWTVLSSPPGSTALVEPPDAVNPTLFVDRMGDYRVELIVYDAQNVASCADPVVVTISVTSGADILIQLTWDTPSDLEHHGQSGADMDLHYLHPQATAWATSPFDCSYNNKNPDWGIRRDSSDDPSLDIETLFDPGPEIITHSNLENVTYKVGVYYYSDHGYGASNATIRIYKHDIEAFVHEDRYMTSGQFWDVARISGRSLEISTIDRIHQDYP